MRSDIRNIQHVCKYGAFGNTNAIGFWIYGKRRDGKTVACKNRNRPDGGIAIWSEYFDEKGEFAEDMTEFSGDEWRTIGSAEEFIKQRVGNTILDSRAP